MTVERSLREAWGMWSIGHPDPAGVIRLACDALVDGLDSPNLRELASLSIEHADANEVRPLLFSTLSDLGERPPDFETDAAKLLALQFYCDRYLSGELTPRELASWAHGNIGHQGPEIAQDLVLLDDEMDDVGGRPRDFRTEAETRARAFLATFEAQSLAAQSGEETVELWRPTGPEELELVRQSNFRRWPPRLPDQPIFYPVLNLDYATTIARDWNVKASGIGYVTHFRVRKSFLDRYKVQQAGGETILEYWIPAEDLEELNDNIVGIIEEVARFE